MEKGPPASAMVNLTKREEDQTSREARSLAYTLSFYTIRNRNTKVSEGIELTERFTKILKGYEDVIYKAKDCPREKLEKFSQLVDVFRDLTKVVSVKVNTAYRVPMELIKARATVADVFVSLVSATESDLKAKVDLIRLDSEAHRHGAFNKSTIFSKEPAYQTYIERIRGSLNETDGIFQSAKIIKAPKSALLIR